MNGHPSLRTGTPRNRRAGVTFIELLVVLAIISILAALYLPAVARAFVRIKTFLGGLQ